MYFHIPFNLKVADSFLDAVERNALVQLLLLHQLNEDVQSPLVDHQVVPQTSHLSVQLHLTRVQDPAEAHTYVGTI